MTKPWSRCFLVACVFYLVAYSTKICQIVCSNLSTKVFPLTLIFFAEMRCIQDILRCARDGFLKVSKKLLLILVFKFKNTLGTMAYELILHILSTPHKRDDLHIK